MRTSVDADIGNLFAGVDIGNNTTEVAIARTNGKGDIQVLSSALVRTVGMKGTLQNTIGVCEALNKAIEPLEIPLSSLDMVLINEATPVIGGRGYGNHYRDCHH